MPDTIAHMTLKLGSVGADPAGTAVARERELQRWGRA